MKKITAAITHIGKFLPEDILNNRDLEKIVSTTDDWITSRTGIKERRIINNGEPTSYLAVKAVEEAFPGDGGQDLGRQPS